MNMVRKANKAIIVNTIQNKGCLHYYCGAEYFNIVFWMYIMFDLLWLVELWTGIVSL